MAETSFKGCLRSSSSSSLKITDRSFRYASPCLWNHLSFSLSLRQPRSVTSSSISDSPIPSPITSSSRTAFTDYCPDGFFWATRFLFFPYFFSSVQCATSGWPSRLVNILYHIVATFRTQPFSTRRVAYIIAMAHRYTVACCMACCVSYTEDCSLAQFILICVLYQTQCPC